MAIQQGSLKVHKNTEKYVLLHVNTTNAPLGHLPGNLSTDPEFRARKQTMIYPYTPWVTWFTSETNAPLALSVSVVIKTR